MIEKLTDKAKDELLKEARERLALCIKHEAEDRLEAAEDFRFYAGEQWPSDMRQLRQVEKRPVLTINKLPAFLHQVLNDQRQNRPSIKVHPVDNGADVDVAEVEQGMIRYIEYNSNADVAYDTAVSHATIGGKGFFALRTDYTDPASFDQEILFRRIQNPFTVYIDPWSTEPDGSDMRFAFITELMGKTEFEADYPKADAINAETLVVGMGDTATVWMSDDSVRIAEYYRIETEQATLCRLNTGEDVFKDELPDELPDGLVITKERSTERSKVCWYKITGKDILEQTEIPCRWIPVFPVYGDENIVDGRIRHNGMVRFSRDPQRMYNFWMAESLETPVPTTDGWKTIGTMCVGDKVFSESGAVANVIGKSPVHIGKECYEITFGDGSKVVAAHDHPWPVEDRGKRVSSGFKWKSVNVNTEDLDPKRHCIKVAGPLQLPDAALPVDPYFLGNWLGDGSSASGEVTPGDEDIDEVMTLFAGRGLNVGHRRHGVRADRFTVHGEVGKLRELGVLNNKHIPALYLRASVEQRFELLRGLMDSDGSISSANHGCCYSGSDTALVDGVHELLCSLGVKVGRVARAGRVSLMANGAQIVSGESEVLSFSPPADVPIFKLARKLAVQFDGRKRHARRTMQHTITSVVKVPSVPVQCIGIDAPSHLFLCGKSMIPTHNTSATEEVSLRPKTPFIGALGQFDTAKKDWRQANTRSFAFLEYDPVTVDGAVAPPPQRQPMADVPVGVLAMAMHASDNIKATTGIFDASLGAQGNETSGRAITARQREGDTANFHFGDNLTRTIRHAGRCIVNMIPKIYDTQRIVRILGEDAKMDTAEINKPLDQPEQGQDGTIRTVLNDLTIGKYDVTMGVGPSYSTKRAEFVDAAMQLGSAVPQIWQAAGDLIVRGMDWPQAEEIADRLGRMIPPEIKGTDNQDENAPQPLPPQVIQALQQAQQELQALQQALQEAQSGMEAKKLDGEIKLRSIELQTGSAERIAAMNNDVKHDIAELAGVVTLLAKQVAPPPVLAADVAADTAEDLGKDVNEGAKATAKAPEPVAEPVEPAEPEEPPEPPKPRVMSITAPSGGVYRVEVHA